MGRVVRAAQVTAAERRAGARAEADELLEQARSEAVRLVAEADRQAEAVLQAARAEGFEAGRAEAAGLLAAAVLARDRALAGLEGGVVDLALEVARKLVGRQLEAAPQLAVELAAAALGRARGARAAVLRVAPTDLATLAEATGPLARLLGEGGGLRLEADEAIEPGGCVVESDLGRVDARLETGLRAIERALRDADG